VSTWKAFLPAGLWIWGGKAALDVTRIVMRARLVPLRAIFRMIRVSGRLYRTGFTVWRQRQGKWR